MPAKHFDDFLTKVWDLQAKAFTNGSNVKVFNVLDFADDGDPLKNPYVVDFGIDPYSYPDTYAKVLMACEAELIVLLYFLYPRYSLSSDVVMTWLVLIRRGYLPQLLHTSDRANVERFMLVNAGVSTAMNVNMS